METCQTAIRRIRRSFPPKCTWTGFRGVRPNPWFGRPPLAVFAHRPSLVHCLVDPGVGVSVPGLHWSVWSVRWATFSCVTQDAIFCDFVCVFFVFSSYSGLVFL